MASGVKCPYCKGCMEWIWVGKKRYLYCNLDRKYFIKESSRVKKEIPDPTKEGKEGLYNVGTG